MHWALVDSFFLSIRSPPLSLARLFALTITAFVAMCRFYGSGMTFTSILLIVKIKNNLLIKTPPKKANKRTNEWMNEWV